MPIPQKQFQGLVDNFNQNLPLKIDNTMTLIRTSAINKEGINSWVFYYLINYNLGDLNLKEINSRQASLVQQACTTEPTSEVLKHSTVVTYQYLTLDQKMLPPLHILPRDCHVYWNANK